MKTNLLHPVRNHIAVPNFAVDPPGFDLNHTAFLKEFGRVEMRPIRPSDERRMIRFHETLSEESIFLRYFEHISLDTRTLHERLERVCLNTPDSFAIVAESHESGRRSGNILAVGRLTTTETLGIASFAVLTSPNVQETPLPRHLLKRLMAVARAFGFAELQGELLVGDHDAISLCRDLGFTEQTLPEESIVRVTCPL
jgi:acetyltransferase